MLQCKQKVRQGSRGAHKIGKVRDLRRQQPKSLVTSVPVLLMKLIVSLYVVQAQD